MIVAVPSRMASTINSWQTVVHYYQNTSKNRLVTSSQEAGRERASSEYNCKVLDKHLTTRSICKKKSRQDTVVGQQYVLLYTWWKTSLQVDFSSILCLAASLTELWNWPGLLRWILIRHPSTIDWRLLRSIMTGAVNVYEYASAFLLDHDVAWEIHFDIYLFRTVIHHLLQLSDKLCGIYYWWFWLYDDLYGSHVCIHFLTLVPGGRGSQSGASNGRNDVVHTRYDFRFVYCALIISYYFWNDFIWKTMKN